MGMTTPWPACGNRFRWRWRPGPAGEVLAVGAGIRHPAGRPGEGCDLDRRRAGRLGVGTTAEAAASDRGRAHPARNGTWIALVGQNGPRRLSARGGIASWSRAD